MKDTDKHRDPIPEDFGSEEEAAIFWDSHSLAGYEDLLEPVGRLAWPLICTSSQRGSIPMRQLLSELPPDAAALMRDLLAEDLTPAADLRTEISDYLAELKSAAETHEFIDLETAAMLGAACHVLLGRITDDTPVDHRRMIQAAVRYLILDDDAEGDLSSPIGFDDDAEVIRAVAAAVGAGDVAGSL